MTDYQLTKANELRKEINNVQLLIGSFRCLYERSKLGKRRWFKLKNGFLIYEHLYYCYREIELPDKVCNKLYDFLLEYRDNLKKELEEL